MTTSSFYSRLSEKQACRTRGFSMHVKKFNPTDSQYSKSRGLFITTSDLNRLFCDDFTKRLHVNGKSAALFFYTKDNLPWTGTKYYKLDENCPDLIVRHIRFHKYWGEVKVVEIHSNTMIIDTIQGRKCVVKKVFLSNVVDSINQWIGKEELERFQFNERMDNTDNYFDNYATL